MDDRARSHLAYAEAFTAMAESVPDGWVERRAAAVAAVAGSPVPLFNQVVPVGEGPIGDVLGLLERIEEAGLRGAVAVRAGDDAALESSLEDRGMGVGMQSPGMVTPLDRVPEDRSGLEFRSGPEWFEVHRRMVAGGFDMPLEVVDTFMTESLVARDDVVCVVGLLDGAPASTAIGFMSDGVVTLFNVVTPGELRGRGYGGAVTAAVMRHAAARGCDLASLQSTDAGFGVYRRLGFETVIDYRMWVTP